MVTFIICRVLLGRSHRPAEGIQPVRRVEGIPSVRWAGGIWRDLVQWAAPLVNRCSRRGLTSMLDVTHDQRFSAIQLAVVDACLSLLAGLALVSLGIYALFVTAGLAW